MRYRARHARPSRLLTRTAICATAATTTAGALTAVTASPASASSVGDSAVAIASRQAGDPYVWGAAGPNSFDCSGLVMYVYRQLGISLPHNSSAQYGAMRHVPQSQKQPGDVLFVHGSGRITHVGIYAGGNSWWVARRAGTTVTRQTLYTSSYYVGRPAGGTARAVASSVASRSSAPAARAVSLRSTPLLRIGSQGSAVVALQRKLHISADGEFGPQTRRAVLAFQRSHRLAADGVVGPRTWGALRA